MLYTKSAGFAAGAISRSRRLRVGGRWLTPLRAHGSCESSGGIGFWGLLRARVVLPGPPRSTPSPPPAHPIGRFSRARRNGTAAPLLAADDEVDLSPIRVP